MLFRPLEGQEGGKARIVFIGRLSAQKNPLLLIEALEGLDLELDMVGDGDLRATAEREDARRGVKARIHGNLPHQNLPEMFNAGRIFVLPFSYEGTPKTPLDAWADGDGTSEGWGKSGSDRVDTSGGGR